MNYIFDNQCFPCFNYIKNLIDCPYVLLEGCEAYQKNSFRNRYIILGSNGPIQLTLPIKGGRNQKALIQEVEIDYTQNWQIKHWRSLESSYKNSPYFDHYEESLKSLIFSDEKYLFKFNLNAMEWIISTLKVESEIAITNTYNKIYEKNVDFRNVFLPKNACNVSQEIMVKYPQVFEERHGFVPNLSYLDLLFNTGPSAIDYFRK